MQRAEIINIKRDTERNKVLFIFKCKEVYAKINFDKIRKREVLAF